jgi:hypothetical protein
MIDLPKTHRLLTRSGLPDLFIAQSCGFPGSGINTVCISVLFGTSTTSPQRSDALRVSF